MPGYDELQEQAARATVGLQVREALELGTGTGESAVRVLARHPDARLSGIDESPAMLGRAREALPADRVRELRAARLQDPLPQGPFDLVLSVLAVHHLTAAEKRALFRRVASALRPGGALVLGDVVVPEPPEEAVTPLEPGYDLPDRLDEQLRWLRDAGLEPETTWARGDLAVVRATRP